MPTAQEKRDIADALTIWWATLAVAFFIGLILEIPSALDRTASASAEDTPRSNGAPPTTLAPNL